MNEKYYVLELKLANIDKKLLDLISQKAAEEYGCSGILDFDLPEQDVDQILGKRAYSGGNLPSEVISEVEESSVHFGTGSFQFFFYGEEMEVQVHSFQKYLKTVVPSENLILELKEGKDWNQEWRKHYKSFEVSSRLKVVPEWEKEENHRDQNSSVYIYPGMGFGTGEHETTFLCLKLMEDLESFGITCRGNCLDFGCGSGILGIAAIKRLGVETIFCDIDREALENCRHNMELNFYPEELSRHRLVIRDRYVEGEKQNLVFANILEGILIEESSLIFSSLKSGGVLIVSGLLRDQIDGIVEDYSKRGDMDCLKTDYKGDWGAILLRKR